jgi:hypothetical protein
MSSGVARPSRGRPAGPVQGHLAEMAAHGLAVIQLEQVFRRRPPREISCRRRRILRRCRLRSASPATAHAALDAEFIAFPSFCSSSAFALHRILIDGLGRSWYSGGERGQGRDQQQVNIFHFMPPRDLFRFQTNRTCLFSKFRERLAHHTGIRRYYTRRIVGVSAVRGPALAKGRGWGGPKAAPVSRTSTRCSTARGAVELVAGRHQVLELGTLKGAALTRNS